LGAKREATLGEPLKERREFGGARPFYTGEVIGGFTTGSSPYKRGIYGRVLQQGYWARVCGDFGCIARREGTFCPLGKFWV